MPPRKRLGQLLTELGVIDEHQLQSALGHQKQWGGKLGAILVQKGFCSEDQMVAALTQHLALPRVKLSEAKIDPRAQKCVSRQIAEKLHVFPYELSGSGRSEVVTVAMSDPTDLSAVDQLAFHTGKRIKPMLAGDSEVLNAIHAHYGAPEEKKEPTDKLAQQKPAAAGTPARRIDSPPAGAPRPSPYIPPAIPAAKPPSRQEQLDEIEPDEVMAPPADRARPAAAEREEASGNAGDAVEGFIPASIGNEPAERAAWPSAEEAAPAQQDAQGWADASEDVSVDDAGWGTEAEAQPTDMVGEELPADAILGAPAGTADSAAGTPATGWATATEEAPAPQATSFEDLRGPGGDAAAEGGDQQPPIAADEGHAPAEEQQPANSDAPLPIEDGIEVEQELAGAVVEEVPVELSGDEGPAGEREAAPGETGPEAEEAAPEDVGYEAEAPDAWASSEDPLAAQGADVPAWGEVPREGSADHAAGPGATQEFANPFEQAAGAQGEGAEAAEGPAAEEPPAEWGAAGDVPVEEAPQEELPPEEAPEEELQFEEAPQEELPLEEAPHEVALEEPATEDLQAEEAQPEAPGAGEYAEQGEEAGLQLEGWVAPPEEPEPQGAGWIGESLEASVPLAPSDLDALASVGLDPNDGVGALRLLAALVRILKSRQLIDPEELAAEIRESRAQGAAAAAEQSGAYEEPGADDAPADPGSAET